MNPRILITVKGGCIQSVIADGNVDVIVDEQDNRVVYPAPVDTEDRMALTERLNELHFTAAAS